MNRKKWSYTSYIFAKFLEFSESLGEMGNCLEQIAPHNDEESSKRLRLSLLYNFYFLMLYCDIGFSSVGRILFMLGKVQFDLQKLLDTYVSCSLQSPTL